MSQDTSVWKFRLFVAGSSSAAQATIAQLDSILRDYLFGGYDLEVVDLLQHPELARDHQILAVPTLDRIDPRPRKRVIGDLSNTALVVDRLELRESGV